MKRATHNTTQRQWHGQRGRWFWVSQIYRQDPVTLAYQLKVIAGTYTRARDPRARKAARP